MFAARKLSIPSCCSCGASLCNQPSCSDPVDELDCRYNEEEFCISKCKNDCLKRNHEEDTVVNTVITKKNVSFMSDYFKKGSKYTNLNTNDYSDKSALKTPTTHISNVKKGGKQNVGTAKIRSVPVETIKSKWINKTLASKDDDVDEFLLSLYYIYEKSPKKLSQLKDLYDNFNEIYEFESRSVKP